MGKSMIKFVPYNKCLECEGEIVVVETETNIIKLDKTGLPISNENLIINSKLRCTECGKESNVNIVSMRYIEKANVIPVIRKLKNPFGYTEKD